MLRIILERIIRLRNPNFKFDKAITSTVIFSLFFDKFIYFVRGLRLLIFFKNPRFILIGPRVKMFNVSNIKFGKWVKIENDVYLSALGKSNLIIGNNTGIGAFSRIIISMSFNDIGQYIKIGNNVGLGEYAYLGGAGGLEIGDDCIIGQYLSCHPENHNYENSNQLIRLQGTTRKGIKIGNNCWIGSKVTILDGVTIGNNCVIAAGAVITKSMPSNTIIGGVPAKVLKEINQN